MSGELLVHYFLLLSPCLKGFRSTHESLFLTLGFWNKYAFHAASHAWVSIKTWFLCYTFPWFYFTWNSCSIIVECEPFLWSGHHFNCRILLHSWELKGWCRRGNNLFYSLSFPPVFSTTPIIPLFVFSSHTGSLGYSNMEASTKYYIWVHLVFMPLVMVSSGLVAFSAMLKYTLPQFRIQMNPPYSFSSSLHL